MTPSLTCAKVLKTKGYDIGEARLWTLLRQKGWVFKSQGRWEATASAVSKGYLVLEQLQYDDTKHQVKVPYCQTFVTLKGLQKLEAEVISWGVRKTPARPVPFRWDAPPVKPMNSTQVELSL
jgi:phage antirepressor YoqD-like protein